MGLLTNSELELFSQGVDQCIDNLNQQLVLCPRHELSGRPAEIFETGYVSVQLGLKHDNMPFYLEQGMLRIADTRPKLKAVA